MAEVDCPVGVACGGDGSNVGLAAQKGMVFNPLAWTWSLSDRDLSVNYVTASIRR